MKTVELELEDETLEEIGGLADEHETSRAEIVRALLAYSLKHVDRIFGDEEPTEDLEDENDESEDD